MYGRKYNKLSIKQDYKGIQLDRTKVLLNVY